MSRVNEYIDQLRHAPDQTAYLRDHSGLPGPRGNLELMYAAVEIGRETDYRGWIALGFPLAEEERPTDEFLAMCGVVGLGRLVAAGPEELVDELRGYASDRRWRVREAVAMALQQVGDANIELLLRIASDWVHRRPYVQRAAIAGLAEPRLLRSATAARAAIDLVGTVTSNLESLDDRRSDEFRTLRQSLGYCWSVVVAADPDYGKPRMELLASSTDADVRWLLRENLKKNRLIRLDPGWAERLRGRLTRPKAET
jgi:hypothetical protein